MTSSALHSVDGQAPKDLKAFVVIAEAPPHPAQGRRMCGRRLPDCRLLQERVAVVRHSGSDKLAIATSPCADNAQTLRAVADRTVRQYARRKGALGRCARRRGVAGACSAAGCRTVGRGAGSGRHRTVAASPRTAASASSAGTATGKKGC
eukprot:306764-Chlamydomonas_euryale.AAC.1